MSFFATDPDTGDLLRPGASFVRVSGLDEIVSHVRIRLRLLKKEIPLAQNLGMDMFGLVLVKGTPLAAIEGEYRSQILDTPGMVSIDKLAFSQDSIQESDRALALDWAGTISLDDLAARIPVHDRFTIPAAFTTE